MMEYVKQLRSVDGRPLASPVRPRGDDFLRPTRSNSTRLAALNCPPAAVFATERRCRVHSRRTHSRERVAASDTDEAQLSTSDCLSKD